ncbi:MAG: TlpA family protein disulfide reductase [Pirellulales bacterium]|nr:TlpA family protein disulfide reductase [Pirellulales bacterium]
MNKLGTHRDWAVPALGVVMLFLAGSGGCGRKSPQYIPPHHMPAAGTQTEIALAIGDSFPQLKAVDVDDNEFVMGPDQYGSKATLIVFWSTWCGFCMQELPHEVELSQQYADAGLRVIGINGDRTPEIAKRAIAEHQVPWTVLYEGRELTISRQLGISSWPTLILLDHEGKVLNACPWLRSHGIEVLPDGTRRQVSALDWTLAKVLGTGKLAQEVGNLSDEIGPMTVMFVVMGILVVVAVVLAAIAVVMVSGLIALMAIIIVGLLGNARPAWRWVPIVWLLLATLAGLAVLGIAALWIAEGP